MISTGITKETYLDMMEMSFDAYSLERIQQRDKLDLQVYSRLMTVLSCLIAAGRKQELLSLWNDMMTECCQEIITLRENMIADFSIKEIMFSLKLMKGNYSSQQEKAWFSYLRQVDPYVHFGSVLRRTEDTNKLHNINVYNMVGEFLRETEGLTDTTAYFSKHWPLQLLRFNMDGMYMDPGCPILYDLTTRCQLQLMMGFAYEGEYADRLDDHLRNAGIMSLYTQSAAFQLPYGGRSNQFLFNEILIAANAEYEASRYKQLGELELAGAFKRSAHLAVQSVMRWLYATPPRHIKNMYPIELNYGTESYGFYEKYMITLGAFLCIGYWFADDSIPECVCPAETGGYIKKVDNHFGFIYANAGGYSLQIDTSGNPTYDSTGLGRLHRAGVPTELALSVPLSAGAGCLLKDGVARIAASISAGWKTDQGDIRYLSQCGDDLAHELIVHEERTDLVRFTLKYEGSALGFDGKLVEDYELCHQGLKWTSRLDTPSEQDIYVRFPVLLTNGQEITTISHNEHSISVRLGAYEYRVAFCGNLELDLTPYGNRNGEYGLAIVRASGSMAQLHFQLQELR
ncbi:hypothetical protein [Paenibacillus sp. PL2-23]|uniref:hypothetical protein n=1 Tax=Paenibacillus sp. PL2-23 TaxID=2100729 RepID=UPI0030F8227D